MTESETSKAYFSALEVQKCVQKQIPIVERMRTELAGMINDRRVSCSIM